MLSLFFIIFAIDKRKCVGHNERRALLKLDLLIKFSQNLNTEKVEWQQRSRYDYILSLGITIYSH